MATKSYRQAILLVIVLSPLLLLLWGEKSGAEPIRPAAVAGRFYPESPESLRAAIQAFMREAIPRKVKKPIALVVPHAGYLFSGQIAADGFKQVEGEAYDTIIILGTNHTTPGLNKVSVYNGQAFRTPLGLAEVDRTLVDALMASCKDCLPDEKVHRDEHSIEVQIPFIQVLFPKARIVPIVVGSADPDLAARFGQTLAGVLKSRRALIVASSDLSHYPAAAQAEIVDPKILNTMILMDVPKLKATIDDQLKSHVPNLDTCACGEAPILAAIEAARHLGAQGAQVISYAHSAESGLADPNRVVGYGAVVFTAEKGIVPLKVPTRPYPYSDRFSPAEKKALLNFARESLRRFLTTGTVPLARGFGENLEQRRGVFVTLKSHGELRGCIGRTVADLPLARAVGAMALNAALADPRFSPLKLKELPEIEIEISVLTKPKEVNLNDIKVGRDGVVLTKGGKSALFLPQVALEQKWDRNRMLDELCLKAGLDRSCWRQGAQLASFQAIVFDESSPKSQ
ncbi:MAG TPA: AmmeMemoRadiSam system protein B [Thermodesulfobacteriota bacterium]|nr:AmmeMemoRadiSam system protein B [Thermodesulfobacteriota bacterium]